jgi:hypothetical protein
LLAAGPAVQLDWTRGDRPAISKSRLRTTLSGQFYRIRRYGASEWRNVPTSLPSAINTDLPVPPSRTHLMLKCKTSWVEPVIGPHDLVFQEHPERSVEQWHRHHKLR